MVFASLVFLYLYLPLFLLLYFSVRHQGWRNSLIVAFSLFFYGWGEPLWISLLIFATTFDYVVARIIAGCLGTQKAKVALVISLMSNLGILAVFKYSDLIVRSINDVAGIALSPPGFALPVGISFYTFHTINYVVDVYRGEVPAQRSYLKMLLFVSLFPQLVAGPIVRYVHVANDIDHRTTSWELVSKGLTRVCFGLFKKVCIANVAGELVHRYLDGDLATLSVAEAWFGLLMFTVQIYFDFSGYSDMAIGLGLMMGFHIHENFKHPYVARSVSDFWRRWHISLSSFFRDYVYIPLGGKNRRPYRNLFIVWALTGLWHGASWNFMLWGLYFGVLIAAERLFLAKLLERLPRALQHGYLLFLVVVGWALFYFTDFTRLAEFGAVLFGRTDAALAGPDVGGVVLAHAFWIVLTIALCMPVGTWLKERVRPRPGVVVVVGVVALNVAIVLLCTALLVGKSYNPFLYFRF
ncbi:MAG: MBOAT family O-acyltransferase [Deltaproteobacteria bacterium]|nr:MBOAT family O-acyltransferase [Deltaproteobacteria bacterium]